MAEKLAAFRAFDWEGDEAWKAYKLNLEVPPGKEALLEKFKAKWYQRNIDADFDVGLVSAAPKPAPAAAEAPRREVPTTSAPEQPRSAPTTTAGAATGGLPDLRQLALLGAHVFIVLSAAVSLVPLNRYLAYRAYFLCLRVAVLSFIYKLMTKYGVPRLTPFPGALKAWMQPVAGSSDFYYTMCCMLMLQSPNLWLGIIPVAILSLYHASAFMNSHFGGAALWQRYGLLGHRWLAANQEAALRLCALCDIAMGFQAILGVLRSGLRGAMLAYVYWNQLRLRFWTPDSRAYHVWAWNRVGANVAPLLAAVPALQRYIAMAQRWFEAPMQQAQGAR